jgi:hypothetical protein
VPPEKLQKKPRRKSIRTAPIEFTVRGADSVIHFIPIEPMKAELHTRQYKENPDRMSFLFGDTTVIFYKDDKKGFIMRDEKTLGHFNYSNLKTAFYEISVFLRAGKNTKTKRNVRSSITAETREEIQKKMKDVVDRCLK